LQKDYRALCIKFVLSMGEPKVSKKKKDRGLSREGGRGGATHDREYSHSNNSTIWNGKIIKTKKRVNEKGSKVKVCASSFEWCRKIVYFNKLFSPEKSRRLS